jgi:thiosulfate reductase cytochrome b subunit
VKKTVYIYKAFERFWHWTQALLIFFLATTGFEIHGSIRFFGYENAVEYHNAASYAFIVLIFFAIFWHLTTGEWKQYVPTMKNIKSEINYYLIGIFRNVPHPTKKTVLSKLNPLQKLVYFGLKILVIPVMVVSGILYMFYRYPQQDSIVGIKIDSLEINRRGSYCRRIPSYRFHCCASVSDDNRGNAHIQSQGNADRL